MSLIKCSECGKEISNRSSSCIKCGYPFASETWLSAQSEYSWREVYRKEESGKALFVTQNVVDIKPFDIDGFNGTTWEQNSLRRHLNGEFLNLLPRLIKQKTVAVKNVTPDKPEYGASGSDTTNDKVFYFQWMRQCSIFTIVKIAKRLMREIVNPGGGYARQGTSPILLRV